MTNSGVELSYSKQLVMAGRSPAGTQTGTLAQ